MRCSLIRLLIYDLIEAALPGPRNGLLGPVMDLRAALPGLRNGLMGPVMVFLGRPPRAAERTYGLPRVPLGRGTDLWASRGLPGPRNGLLGPLGLPMVLGCSFKAFLKPFNGLSKAISHPFSATWTIGDPRTDDQGGMGSFLSFDSKLRFFRFGGGWLWVSTLPMGTAGLHPLIVLNEKYPWPRMAATNDLAS